jgi:hypothetical protein
VIFKLKTAHLKAYATFHITNLFRLGPCPLPVWMALEYADTCICAMFWNSTHSNATFSIGDAADLRSIIDQSRQSLDDFAFTICTYHSTSLSSQSVKDSGTILEASVSKVVKTASPNILFTFPLRHTTPPRLVFHSVSSREFRLS